MRIRHLIWSALWMFALIGCATTPVNTHALQSLSLNMSKAEVVKVMGNPSAVRGALKNKYGQTIEVWEYTLNTVNFGQVYLEAIAVQSGGTPLPPGYGSTVYWLYFADNRLVQWGQAGDWAKEADRIYEVRFGSNAVLTSPP